MTTMRSFTTLLALGALSAVAITNAGCPRRNTGDAGPGGNVDSGVPTDTRLPPGVDTNPFFSETGVNPCAPSCGPEELCGMGEGNGLDDNCNGEVDEICACTQGTTRGCFLGPPDRRDIGACSDGITSCGEFGWGPCTGGIFPSAETCDGIDNDCDGTTDQGLDGCVSRIMCPGFETAAPLARHTLDSGRVGISDTSATGYEWTVSCPDSVPADLCPSPDSPNSATSSIYFTQSGAYRAQLRMTLADGTEANCAWAIYVRGGTGSLRVETTWDTVQDGSDIDLHVHRWTNNDNETDWFNADDCYFGNCTVNGSINWSMPTSPVANCSDAPRGIGDLWVAEGSCRNPRLDIDTNAGGEGCQLSQTDPQAANFCAPENINIDNPLLGRPYRVMVNYYSSHAVATESQVGVNIYCGGNLRASFGYDPPQLFSVDDGGGGGFFGGSGQANTSWIVADVVFFNTTCGLDCNVYPLNNRIMDSADFGPAWSCRHDAEAMTCVR
jgi:hypothetical protein